MYVDIILDIVINLLLDQDQYLEEMEPSLSLEQIHTEI
jgi:hypothetical protein